MNYILNASFQAHDFLTQFFAKNLVVIKRTLLIIAHLCILGFFFPDLRKFFGEQSLNVLLFLLLLGPLSKILRMRLLLVLMSYRRQLGILMAYLATVHGLGYLLDPLWLQTTVNESFFASIRQLDPRYLVGLIAYVLTLPLLVTSNDLAVRLLGRNWKRLHFLVYGVFVFAILHKFTVGRGFSDTGSVIQAGIVILSYCLLKWWTYKDLPRFLESWRKVIAEKYQLYRVARKVLYEK